MSFSFEWPRFSDQFHADAIQLLNNALNKGNKPPVIADKIEVVELEMGTQPPELEIRDIGDLTMNQFRGIFRMNYAGDAHIVLRTKVQANPLYHKKTGIHRMGGSKGMVAANQPLVVPMLLRLSNFKLNSVVVLVVSKAKGITLVFKTDPLQNVDIHSTFDSIAVIQKFIQNEIEGQLRQMFREDLPGIIHRLSQQWVKKSTTVETPYIIRPARPPTLRTEYETMSNPDLHSRQPYSSPSSVPPPSPSNRRFSSTRSVTTRPSISNLRSASVGPDYGYGFDSEPQDHLPYTQLTRLYRERKSRGLAGLSEEGRELEFDEESFDVVDWEETMSSVAGDRTSVVEYETTPAIGGGVISRPRVYHSSSLLHPSGTVSNAPSRTTSSTRLTAPALEQFTQSFPTSQQPPMALRRESWDSTIFSERYERHPEFVQGSSTTIGLQRTVIAPSSENPPPPSTAPALSEIRAPLRPRRDSTASSLMPYDLSFPDDPDADPDPKIILRPGTNNTVSQLSLLNRSNQTLSPYTRTLEHFTIRSMPPRTVHSRGPVVVPAAERQPVKAKRKRTYRLGSAAKAAVKDALGGGAGDNDNIENIVPASPRSPLSDFDPADIDRYFKSLDDLSAHLGADDQNAGELRRRTSRRKI